MTVRLFLDDLKLNFPRFDIYGTSTSNPDSYLFGLSANTPIIRTVSVAFLFT